MIIIYLVGGMLGLVLCGLAAFRFRHFEIDFLTAAIVILGIFLAVWGFNGMRVLYILSPPSNFGI
ncbi:hypothetical protein DmGdi_16690 [Gluconobacter sp. Gdi]|nr:hypothetical protein DmGdi_16690 [Gluconobacter sp. Gdi]